MLFAMLGAVVVFAYFSTFSRPVTTVILVRHAEKKIEPTIPIPICARRFERAQEIARVFGDAGINAIYATQYKRTQQTSNRFRIARRAVTCSTRTRQRTLRDTNHDRGQTSSSPVTTTRFPRCV
jgi:hypothetical protein